MAEPILEEVKTEPTPESIPEDEPIQEPTSEPIPDDEPIPEPTPEQILEEVKTEPTSEPILEEVKSEPTPESIPEAEQIQEPTQEPILEEVKTEPAPEPILEEVKSEHTPEPILEEVKTEPTPESIPEAEQIQEPIQEPILEEVKKEVKEEIKEDNKIINNQISSDDDMNLSDNTNSIISTTTSSITSSNTKDTNSFINMYVSDLSTSNSNISGNLNKYEYVVEYVNNILDSSENNKIIISDINKTDIMPPKEGLTFNDIITETNLGDTNKENAYTFDKISTASSASSNNNLIENTTFIENPNDHEPITNDINITANQLENVIIKNENNRLSNETIDNSLIIRRSNIPDLIENTENPEKHQVSFSHININDINEMKPINESINMNNQFGNNSITTSSDFSYTRAIKSRKIPNIQPIFGNKNIRLAKTKSKKKIIELDEVDYLYNKLQDYRRNMIINTSNYIILIAKAMEIIEDYSELQNNNKKDTVVKALNRLVMIDLDLNEFDQRFFLSSLSNIIELIIVCTRTKSNNYDKKHSTNKYDMSDDITRANCGQIIYSIVDKLTTIVLKKQYNADKLFTNIATITEILMILVDKYNYITGTEKKMIVLQAIHKFIYDKLEYIIELSPEKKQDLVNSLDSIPLTIDLFIALQKGKYKINKKQNMVVKKTSWLKSLCGGSKQHTDE